MEITKSLQSSTKTTYLPPADHRLAKWLIYAKGGVEYIGEPLSNLCLNSGSPMYSRSEANEEKRSFFEFPPFAINIT